MTKGEIIVAIVVAIIGLFGTSAGSIFGYIQYQQKRKDEKEENTVEKMIADANEKAKEELREEIAAGIQEGIAKCGEIGDEAIAKMKKELQVEIADGLQKRSEEGAERFNKHAASIEEINTQIKENSQQISELTELSKNQLKQMEVFTDSIAALSKTVRLNTVSQRNNNYDRILVVAKNILKARTMTISDKTNLQQLYSTWKEMHGDTEDLDPEIVTLYDECMKITPTVD